VGLPGWVVEQRLMWLLGWTEQDEREAIDKGNIMKDRTRGAKPMGTYKEPTDEQMMGLGK
jgi:hypothetical protein